MSRVLGDIDLAEDALQEAYVTALERWPRDGFPTRPSAWILTTARNAAIDRLRRERTGREKAQRAILLERALRAEDALEDDAVTAIPDDRLGLIFACCHPALSVESRIALTLRTLAGLTTEEIADAFLVAHVTMAQRLVRVKRKIRETRIPFEVPAPERLPQRLDDVCTVLYLIFNEGYAATSGDRVVRRELCDEAIRLCRVLATLMPAEPEVLGLLALMLYADSRRDARVAPDGSLVLLAEQDRDRWNREQIAQANAALDEAGRHRVLGPYQLQARIARVHSVATCATDVDWWTIVDLYERLEAVQPSPVIALNRAVALGYARGPAAALAVLDALPRRDLDGYQFFHIARADALKRLGRAGEAVAAYEAALALTQNAAQQRHLRSLIASAGHPPGAQEALGPNLER
ncbi:MAG TPA: sigma-70 family RNA polymerase sigma factor [Candidatus Baltobacteraceae bacterium]